MTNSLPTIPKLLNQVHEALHDSIRTEHRFATHLIEAGTDIRTAQELLDHESVETTLIDTRVLNKGGLGVPSPLDDLG